MIVKLLTEHPLEFLSLKGGCRGSSESTPVKMSNCWKSHAGAQIIYQTKLFSHIQGELVIYNPWVFENVGSDSLTHERKKNPNPLDML